MGEVENENIILEIFYLPSSCLMRPKGFIPNSPMQMHAYQQHTAMTRAVLWLIGLKFKNLES